MQTATFYLIYKVLHIAPKLLRPKFLQLQKERLMKSPECIKHLMWHDDREVHPYYLVLFARRGRCICTGFGNVGVKPNFFWRSSCLGLILASFTTSGWLGGSLNTAAASFLMVGSDKKDHACSFKSSSTKQLGPNFSCIWNSQFFLFFLLLFIIIYC